MGNREDKDPIVIVGSARTPIGNLLGDLSSLTAPELGAHAIKEALNRAKVKPEEVEEVIMGCVISAGVGQAPARQAAIFAGIPDTVPCSTVNKVCGSGMQAIMNACGTLALGEKKVIVAGGMESMSHAPYLLEKARAGYRLGHHFMKDAMYLDGLEDAYEKVLMGEFAERTAEKYGFSREEQDAYAKTSLTRATEAAHKAWFETDYEITPITVTPPKKEPVLIEKDEHPTKVNPDKIPNLKPSFRPQGSITPGNSCAISDGAAALVLMRLSEAKLRGLKPIAKILGSVSYSHAPSLFTTAPVYAIQKLLKKLNWTTNTVDLYEINEAFACVVLVAMKELNLSHDKVNVHGGACALGNPLGASGARIICTLLGALKHYNKSKGVATLCIGGGESTAIALEMLV